MVWCNFVTPLSYLNCANKFFGKLANVDHELTATNVCWSNVLRISSVSLLLLYLPKRSLIQKQYPT